ncbi:cell division protein FtsI/penicillin-binding protein 2 [Streptosporangium becharense]|uniref:Cell division protein FtsI/penicillin-binding protein 2 n=1 Tax=Streptosporangium becharense TaxID=1816182 RepID=A0A7W9ICC1_9ACTN|nr:penicillin-binding transpeptidase domain-containing protein [Streptosporangium becharense]MBB2915412.1 cell division protein FtsI/penicillin-binding protein 2 [Streptosporangium becharense]MBB5817599.1 cell division protein FtsI/penicillin-binding protein 2 [Streptosporangium becharense]
MPRGRTIAVGTAAAVLVAGAAGGGAWWYLHTRGTPQETAQRFVQAWQRGDLAAMRAELGTPDPAFAATYDGMRKALAVESTRVRLDGVRETGDGTGRASYTATLKLKDVGEWSYSGSVDLSVVDRHWRVRWSPAAVHPDLTGGTSFALKTEWPKRAGITAADGERIDGGDVGGSVQQIAGYVDKATKKEAEKLGPSYRAGDTIGKSGLQAAFQGRLAGIPTTRIQLVGPDKKIVKTVGEIEGADGEELRTTLELKVQRAGVSAIRDLKKAAALVAIRPSTGEILAVVNNRGGFDRALNGNYPPGSTLKAVTAVGLLVEGMSPDDRVTCPKNVTVGGLPIRNSDHAAYGEVSFSDSFAHSCNTTFAPLAERRLGADKLLRTAELFGFNQPLDIGVPAAEGSFPRAQSDAELAAESFGQGRVTASPLVMASVAAALADGTWRPPTLVTSIKQKAEPKPLPEGVTPQIHRMMSAVVTRGTAKKANLPPGTRGKTGTAEFGPQDDLKTHAWFMGFRDDVAFAVIVEEGSGGGAVAAPVAADFLRALG